MINSKNDANKKIISENENPDKVIDIVERILDLNKQYQNKGLQEWTRKQMLKTLPIVLV